MKDIFQDKAPVLFTKISIPTPNSRLVARERLIQFINQGMDKKLILISAPAGFGKSTLLAQWAHQSPYPVVWISLDPLDNDISRFLIHLAAAFEKVQQGFACPFQNLFSTPNMGNLKWIPSFLVQALSAVDTVTFLVLDDVHQIQATEFYQILGFLIEHLPQHIRLILSTREDPRIPLARLRASTQLLEIRTKDLQFLPAEADQLLNAKRHFPLSRQEVETLLGRTEGWAAGLQMAEISLQAQPDASSSIKSFSASNRYVMDFFIEEVWQHQPEQVRSFLLDTSILERMNAGLCERLTGNSESQKMLEALENANLFVLPLDQERRWYRYHNLFAGLLQKRLADQEPERIPVLHRKASEWFLSQGEVSTAIQHALQTGDGPSAAQLILDHAEETLMKSHTLTLLHWIEALPRIILMQSPRLCVYLAWTRLMIAKPLDTVTACFSDVNPDVNDQFVHGSITGLKAMIASMQGDFQKGLSLSRQALETLPDDCNLFRSILIDNSGILNLLCGNDAAAIKAFEEAEEIGRQTGNTLIIVGALSNIAGLHLVRGRLIHASQLFEEALNLSRYTENRYLPIASKPLIGLGDILREQNDLGRAEELLINGIELIKQYSEVGAVMGHLSLARIREAQNDLPEANRIMEEAEKIATRFDASTMDDRLVAAYRSGLWLTMGQVERMLQWKDSIENEVGKKTPAELSNLIQSDPVAGIELMTLARGYLLLKKPQQALDTLEKLCPQGRPGIQHRIHVKLLVLQAIACLSLGNRKEATRVFQEALRLGQTERYVRSFLDEGLVLRPLLEEAIMKGETGPYAEFLLRSLPYSPEQPVIAEVQPVPGPLTDRELEILALIAKGYSNKQIAQTLFLAVDTVKGYTRKVYAKLDAQNRSHAVQIAREEGYLSED